MSIDKKTQPTQQDQEGEGRIYNSNTKRAEQQGSKEDISRVDQQEGSMKNGELGGNLRDTDNQNEEIEKK